MVASELSRYGRVAVRGNVTDCGRSVIQLSCVSSRNSRPFCSSRDRSLSTAAM